MATQSQGGSGITQSQVDSLYQSWKDLVSVLNKLKQSDPNSNQISGLTSKIATARSKYTNARDALKGNPEEKQDKVDTFNEKKAGVKKNIETGKAERNQRNTETKKQLDTLLKTINNSTEPEEVRAAKARFNELSGQVFPKIVREGYEAKAAANFASKREEIDTGVEASNKRILGEERIEAERKLKLSIDNGLNYLNDVEDEEDMLSTRRNLEDKISKLPDGPVKEAYLAKLAAKHTAFNTGFEKRRQEFIEKEDLRTVNDPDQIESIEDLGDTKEIELLNKSDEELMSLLGNQDITPEIKKQIQTEIGNRAEAKEEIIDYDGDGVITQNDRDIHAGLRNQNGDWIGPGNDPELDAYQDEIDQKSEKAYEVAKIEAQGYIKDIRSLITSARSAADIASGQRLLADARGLLDLLKGVNNKVGAV